MGTKVWMTQEMLDEISAALMKLFEINKKNVEVINDLQRRVIKLEDHA